MDIVLTDREARVLGCLIEKKSTTPDLYPLSLNALRNGCNQTTSRAPVVSYDEETVTDALTTLQQKRLVSRSHFGRVSKFEETFLKTTCLVPAEAAILCVLMLRGSQTVGEIRTHTERLYTFESVDAVAAILHRLQEWGYLVLLPRQAGQKESRYAHLLSGPPKSSGEEASAPNAMPPQTLQIENGAIAKLQTEMASVQQELAALKQALLELGLAIK